MPPQPLLPPVVLDADELKQLALDFIAAQAPDWQNVDGDATDLVLTAVAQMMSYGLAQFSSPTDAIVNAIGSRVYRTPPFSALSATSTVTFTTDGTTGVIPSGTYLSVRAADGSSVELQTTAPATVTAPTTTAANVPVVVTDPVGAAGNGLTGDVTIVDRIAFAVSAVLDATTSNGRDAETQAEYNRRIDDLAELIAPRLVLPDDFANGCRLLVPGVARALAIDGYNADTATSDVERCVTVVGQADDGMPVSGPIATAARAMMVSRRESTFLSFFIDPTYTTISFDFAAVAAAGYDTAVVEAGAITALGDLANPRLHGIPSSGDAQRWVDRPKVRYQDAVTALNNVVGLDYYTTLTVNGGTADVTLAGPGGLPELGTITGTVTAP